ncbi:MAG: TRAP transporter small permease [Lentilitoribacter sp.]
MSALKTGFAKIIRFWALLGGFALMLAVLVTVINALGFSANVIVRNFGFNVSGLPGYEDMVTLFVGFAALTMMPFCQLHGGHIAVDVFIKSAPRAIQWFSHLFSTFLMAGIALFFSYMLSQGVEEARGDGTVTSVLGWPVWAFMLPGVFSCLLWFAACLSNLGNLPQQAEVK